MTAPVAPHRNRPRDMRGAGEEAEVLAEAEEDERDREKRHAVVGRGRRDGPGSEQRHAGALGCELAEQVERSASGASPRQGEEATRLRPMVARHGPHRFRSGRSATVAATPRERPGDIAGGSLMNITRKVAAAGVAGILGVTGLAVVVAPVASAVTADDGATTVSDRVQAITEALAGLVTDGTLTQEQADSVATTLDESDALRGPGGHGPGHGGGGVDLSVAAEALGMTEDELRTALEVDGTTLTDVAHAQGVETSALVDALVADQTERLTTAVTEGRLTQEEADDRIAALPERIAAAIEEELRGGGHGRGPRGERRSGDVTGRDSTTDAATADDGTADDAA
ncbi:hypothetical protein [Cellulomonas sp. ATA003]|uniref:hypothetical protein n=1 Tax=Cellulomonas sp. ATA003 TaxID=3073064 RepID=UPI0028737B95|nr:hypothetical protein [Cellulomonas sp. ATA003]WNB86692.1 hypothetical protein REH70_05560 [Cellulomonas sp. ATA003]